MKTIHVDSREAARMRKESKGFCGYNWMVDSIISYGEILSIDDIKKRNQTDAAG